MAKANSPIPSMNRRIVNVYRDEWGRVIVQLDTGEHVVIRPDGSVDKLRFNENKQLTSGEMYNSAMSMGPIVSRTGEDTQPSSRSMIVYTGVQAIRSPSSSKPAIFPTAHLTVVSLRLPQFLPISDKALRVNSRAR